MVGGPETADFEGTLGVREISAGEGVSGQVRLSRASDIITGVLRLLRSQGRAAPSPASDKVLGSGWMALGAAGGRAKLGLRAPAVSAPLSGSGQGVPGQGWPGRGARNAGRTLNAQPAPSPPGAATHRPGGGRIPVSPQCRGLGPARPAGGRQLHAAASSARPASAPPAHFPQEMINSGRGAFPWQPAPTRAGGGGARSLPHTPRRALALARGTAHSAASRLHPGFPLGPAPSRPRTGGHTCRHRARAFLYRRSHAGTRVPHTRSG